MKPKNTVLVSILIVLVVLFLLVVFLVIRLLVSKPAEVPQTALPDYTTKITNKYLSFTPGTNFVYQGKTEEGTERNEVYVTNQTKNIMGIETLVVWDRVWLDDQLIEETYDWYVQDKVGNVWYYGEDSKEYEDGVVVSTEGSWEAGVDGAEAGVVMEAFPKVGDSYRQEYYEGKAEDMTDIISMNVSIKVKYGQFKNCLQTKDWTPLEPDSDEYKYYCPEVANLVYEVVADEGLQLIDINSNPTQEGVKPEPAPTEAPTQEPSIQPAQITQGQAVEIAKSAVDGDVTGIDLEEKFGRAAYVVEIDKDTDVYVDLEEGRILGVENK
jgi:uncharacterized membrane protein YkoI